MSTPGDGHSRHRAIGPGFTLIELLVVIAVIALLVAILMPSLRQAKDLALRAKCAAQIRSLALGINVYGEDNNRWMPYGECSGWGNKLDTGGGLPNRLGLLWVKDGTRSWGSYVARTWGLDMYADYIPDFRNFYCPGKKYNSDLYAGERWDFVSWPPPFWTSRLAGYSYCIPGSVTHQDMNPATPPWRYRIDDYKPPWRTAQSPIGGPPPEWKAIADNLGFNYNAWVACNLSGYHPEVDQPHRGQGNNFAFRDGSVQFINTNKVGDTMFDFFNAGLSWFYANLVYDGLPVPDSWK